MADGTSQGHQRFSDVKNGPKHPYQRSCTDIICCMLFVIGVVVMFGFAVYGYSNGDTTNVYRGTDEQGNVCGGSNSSALNFPYTYFYNPTTGNLDRRTCVVSCPGLNGNSPTPIDCYAAGNNVGDCNYTKTVNSSGQLSGTPNQTEIIGYDTYSVIGRVCIPTATVFNNAFSSYVNTFNDKLRQAGLANFITDVQNNWKWLLLSLILAVVLSFLFMFMLKCFAACFIWVALFLIFLVLMGAGFVFLVNAGVFSQPTFIGNFGINVPNLPSFKYYDIFGYVTFGLAAVVFFIICCCFGRIRLAVALCGIAGEFIASTCTVMLVPIFMALAVFVFWVFALYGMVTIISTAEFVVKGTDVFTGIKDFTSRSLGMFYFFAFGTLWCNAMLMAIAVFVVSAACAVWYFSRSPGMKDLDSPVATGFWMAFRYHFGTLAFGSFILALVQFIQIVFEVLNRQVDAVGEGANCAISAVVNCVRCCLECIKRIVQFINKHAFIQTSITGKNFCGAAGDALALLVANPLRFTIVAIVGWLLAMVGRLLITGLTTFLFYLFISYVTSIHENVQEPIYMLIVVALATLAIATIFMSIFDVSVDTLLQCFLIDEQANVKPQYAHPDLAPLLDS